MEKFLISLVVPIYKVEKYLKRCIESILNQTYKNLEIILVDDGSPDNCGKMCDEYAKKDERIVVIHKENGGLSSARNAGLERAKGKYVLFVDSDDFLVENGVEIVSKKALEKEYDLICFNYYNYLENGISYEMDNVSKYADIEYDKKFMLSQLTAWSRAYKISFLKQNNLLFKEKIIYEDLAFVPSLINYTKNIGYVNEFLYYYTIRENSIMTSKVFNINRDDKFIALETLEKTFEINKSFEKYKKEIEYIHIKHLLVAYSSELLKYQRKIYVSRIKKAFEIMNEKYPSWEKNEYYKNEKKSTKIFLGFMKSNLYFLGKIFCYTIPKISLLRKNFLNKK